MDEELFQPIERWVNIINHLIKKNKQKILNENMKDLRERVEEFLYFNMITIQIQKN